MECPSASWRIAFGLLNTDGHFIAFNHSLSFKVNEFFLHTGNVC